MSAGSDRRANLILQTCPSTCVPSVVSVLHPTLSSTAQTSIETGSLFEDEFSRPHDLMCTPLSCVHLCIVPSRTDVLRHALFGIICLQ